MKRCIHNTRGQFVVVAALLIALLTLSVALSIHQVNLHRQQLRYEPVEELVLGITSDLDRCLTRALSIASQEYYATGSEENATRKGYDFISKWVRSILASYSHLGIKMTINQTEEGLTFNWNNVLGFSQVYAKFDLDVDAYGFKGWVGESRKFVTLKIFPDSILLGTQNTTLKFQIMQGKDQDIPIPNLTPESLKIWADLTGQYPAGEDWIPATVTALNYLGGGKYTVTFNARINERTQGVKLLVITPEDNIYVSARSSKAYSYGDIFLTLQSQEEYSPIPTNLGLIRLGDTIYILPNYTRIDPGIYILRYFPEEGDSFLNWTTIGAVTVGNPRSSITSITIDGNGTITAFYRRYTPPEPIIVNLTLDSRDWTNSSFHLGSITFGSTKYTLPNAIVILAGDYMLQYEPYNSSYVFLQWEPSGDVIPASTVDNPTTLRVIGNGAVIAVYAPKPQTPTLANVTLQSMDENPSAPPNLGKIRFGETLFGLPNSTTVLSGTYLLEYVPEEGYTFLNWATTENIIVQNLNSSITSVTVKGNGIITAFYRHSIPLNLVLDSREWNNRTQHLGNIRLGLTSYTLPNAALIPAGDYTLQYEPYNSSYVFLQWEPSGDVIIWDTGSGTTALTIYGNATVIAVYSSQPPIITRASVFLQSLEETLAPPGNLGQIQLGETLFGLPNSAAVLKGTYLLRYIPAEGYTFLNWTTTGDLSVESSSSSVTSITINGNGTITAFYRGCKVVLGSRYWADSSLTNLGNITFGTNTYALPWNLRGLAKGDYFLQYTPYNSSYVFLWWEFSGDTIPINSNGNPTTLKVIGDGMVIAVYGSEPLITTPVSVNLQSMEETSASENLGKIQLGETIFELPNSTMVFNGTYLLKYIPENASYTFLNWTTTGEIYVENISSSVTSVKVDGNGTITAFYKRYIPPQPTSVNLTLDSRDWQNLTHGLGNITLNSTKYGLPAYIIDIAVGDYTVQYEPPNSSYIFLWWEWSGDVVAWNPYDKSTTLTVIGNGTVIAVYRFEPPPPKQVSVNLESLEETLTPPGNLGKIQLGENLFGLPNSTTMLNGTYLLSYIPAEGYTFLNWTTTAGISVKDSYSPATSVTINNNGTITAFYRGCNVFLDSRHLENLSFSLGSITLGTNTYSLPKRLTSLAAGNYAIQYTPLNSSYTFLRWEVSGDLIPANSTSSTTELRILGDGMLIAVYYVKPPAPTQATVTLRSVEETSASQNLGKIQFGETLFGLPNSTTVLTGSYLLEYIPAEGFSFLKWTTTGNIVVENQYSSLTIVTVNGNGTITAIYRGCKVFLDSIAWDSSSQSLGKITLGSNIYTLPKNVTGLPVGDYLLQYSPHNDSYVFLWWEFSGDIVPWNSTSSNTTLTVYGDGAVTAVYGLISEPPPPFVGDWSTLYVDTGYRLMPPFMWSGKSSHLPSRYSTGTGKQWADLISPPTPTLYLARYVNVTAYVRPNPPWNAKDVTLELGFAYNGQYYFLGSGTYPINSQGVYTLEIDILYGQFPGEIGVIPEGSEIILTVTVTFFKEPWGTFFLYYGPKNPSRVELF